MLWLDGVYQELIEQPQRKPRLHRTLAPSSAQLTHLVGKIAHRVCRHLTRKGWLEGEDESAFLSDRAGCDDGLDALRMSSITYRIATGAHAGRKVTTLQTIPADADAPEGNAGKIGGFSLNAGVAAEAHESQRLERLCRTIARPVISEKRLSRSPQGRVRYQRKTPWKNGTTRVDFEPVELMAHIPVRHPAGDLRSSKSAILSICHCQTCGLGAAIARPPDPLPRGLCAEREVARAADAIAARQTSSCGRGIDWGQQRPPQPRRKAPIEDLGTAPQARVWHRREHLWSPWRHGTDRGQHRRTHRRPRHPRPLRKARRA